ncbi:MAG: hypothetical protein DME92_00440 [Verrucomicrobia bacterium]|nr:MAG: hypothetical protein DME92_00440 [Verrucomicrobiota bacterium]
MYQQFTGTRRKSLRIRSDILITKGIMSAPQFPRHRVFRLTNLREKIGFGTGADIECSKCPGQTCVAAQATGKGESL